MVSVQTAKKVEKAGEETSFVSGQAFVSYASDILFKLKDMASAHEQRFLAYLIEMSAAEAMRLASTEETPERGDDGKL